MFTREKQEMKRVPMMPVRDMVIFPQQMTPFIVGREASVRALEEALAGDKKIGARLRGHGGHGPHPRNQLEFARESRISRSGFDLTVRPFRAVRVQNPGD